MEECLFNFILPSLLPDFGKVLSLAYLDLAAPVKNMEIYTKLPWLPLNK